MAHVQAHASADAHAAELALGRVASHVATRHGDGAAGELVRAVRAYLMGCSGGRETATRMRAAARGLRIS